MVVHLPDPNDPLRLAGCVCPNCRYELKGARHCRCPECGIAIDVDKARFGDPPPTRIRKVLHWISVGFCSIALVWSIVNLCLIVYWGGVTALAFTSLTWFVVVQFFFFYEYLTE